MNKVIDSFWNEHEINFDEYFYNHIHVHVKDREDYKATQRIRHDLMEKYPKIMELFDRDRICGFSDEENEAYLEVLRADMNRITIERKESFKLGFKEALVFLKEQGMLNI